MATQASAPVSSVDAPYRIPIEIVRPSASGVGAAPDFLLCLLDHLLTPEQLAAQDEAADAHSTITVQHDTPASLKPCHDRLPLTLAIESRVTGGVTRVTLMQSSEVAEWSVRWRQQQQQQTPDALTIRFVQAPLSHATRCPCRTPRMAGASEVGPSLSGPFPLLRLAVVVVPTVHSVAHCLQCAPSRTPDASPCARVLLTRRPRSMRAFPGCWVFPGGACDRTDASLEHTGVREVEEETGLRMDPTSMEMVSMWEAVYPVIRPRNQTAPFQAKARYLIAMYASQIMGQDEQVERRTEANADAPSSGTESSSTVSFSSPPSPICVGCLPVRLCSTEVDAGVWLSGEQFDRLRQHATYFHTDDEAQLQAEGDGSATETRCGATSAEHTTCECDWLPARVTPTYQQQNAAHTNINFESSDSQATSVSTSTSTPAPAFLLGGVRACALYGLYPNSVGSGMAEGHLVALEEMRERGMF